MPGSTRSNPKTAAACDSGSLKLANLPGSPCLWESGPSKKEFTGHERDSKLTSCRKAEGIGLDIGSPMSYEPRQIRKMNSHRYYYSRRHAAAAPEDDSNLNF